MCKLTAFDSEEQLYATVSLLPYASLEEMDFSSLKLVSAQQHAHQHAASSYCLCSAYMPATYSNYLKK
jgi:hypothetical protein